MTQADKMTIAADLLFIRGKVCDALREWKERPSIEAWKDVEAFLKAEEMKRSEFAMAMGVTK